MILPNDQPSLYTAYGDRGSFPTDPRYSSPGFTLQVQDWLDRHPAVCVAMALSVGVTLGWLLKRR